MPARTFISLAFVLVTLAVSANLSAADLSNNPRLVLELAQAREAGNHPRGGSKSTRKEETLPTRFDTLTELLGTNKELFVYGAIAAFGNLMMGLAIGSASSNAKSKTNAQLTLLKQGGI